MIGRDGMVGIPVVLGNGDRFPNEIYMQVVGRTAMQELERKGLIAHRRSHVTIVDREGLEEGCNGAYSLPNDD
jgi:hypothetical protein